MYSQKVLKEETFIYFPRPSSLFLCLSEYLCIEDLLPLWSQEVHDAIDGSVQSDATDEEDGQNDVRERGCEVYNLHTHAHVHTVRLSCNFP